MMHHTQHKERQDTMYNGRHSPLTPPAIGIYDNAFSEFSCKLAQTPDRNSFTKEEFINMSDFLHASVKYYESEGQRLTALQPYFNKALAREGVLKETTLYLGSKNVKPDGCHTVDCSGPGRIGTASAVNLLVKGKSEGSLVDPMSQAECCYIAIYCSEEVCSFMVSASS